MAMDLIEKDLVHRGGSNGVSVVTNYTDSHPNQHVKKFVSISCRMVLPNKIVPPKSANI